MTTMGTLGTIWMFSLLDVFVKTETGREMGKSCIMHGSWEMTRVFFALVVCVMCAVSALADPVIVYSTDFDTPEGVKGWKFNSSWKVEPGAGVGGSSALVCVNDDPINVSVGEMPIPGGEGRAFLQGDVQG